MRSSVTVVGRRGQSGTVIALLYLHEGSVPRRPARHVKAARLRWECKRRTEPHWNLHVRSVPELAVS